MPKDITRKKLKGIVFNKDYYLGVTLVTAIVGGLTQAFSLMSLESFYIRFFSVSQMIADTITLLFPILFILFILGLLLLGLTELIKGIKWKRMIKRLYIIQIVFLVLAGLFTRTLLMRALHAPDSFLNQTFICDDTDQNCEIKYFNDKYIFVEKEENKIEVLEFEEFFR